VLSETLTGSLLAEIVYHAVDDTKQALGL